MKRYLAQTEPLPVHPTLRHPVTGEPVRALGWGRRGPIWPVMGGSQPLGEPVPQQTPNTAGIPTLGGGVVLPGQPAPGQPAPGQPAPQPVPGQPAPQPVAGQPGPWPPVQPGQPAPGQPAPGQPQQGQPQQGQPPAPVPGPPPGDRGFPEGVPVEHMSEGQRANFYRHHMRKNQDELRRYADYDQIKAERDQLKTATQTEMQRAAAEAEARGRQAGMSEAGGQVVEAWYRAAAAGRMSEEAITAQLATLNRAAFLNGGQVNTQAIYDHVNVIVGGQAQPYQPQQPQPYAQPPQQPWQQPYNNGGVWPQPAVPYGQQPAPNGYTPPQGGQPYGQPPAQPQPGYGQQVAAPGGWPQYAPVPQPPQAQPNGWAAPGMPGYGQPPYRQVPDYGQGQQQPAPQASAEAGRQKAAQRHGGVTRTQQRNSALNGGRPSA